MTIYNMEGDSLHTYLSRFNVATLKVHNLDQLMAMMALKTYPKSFTEMLTRMEKYANAKEAHDAHPILIEAKADQKSRSLMQALAK